MGAQTYTRNTIPMKGLYTSAMSDLLTPEYTPWCQNVRFRFGNVQRAPGRSLVMQGMAKEVMDFAVVSNEGGEKSLIAITADTLADLTLHFYNESTFNFGTGAVVGAPSTAAWNIRPSWTQGEERLFVCRASTVSALSPLGVVTVLTSPRGCFLEYFNNRVILMRIIDDIPPLPPRISASGGSRITWTKQGVYTEWGTTTGLGGFLELYDGQVEPITGGKVLNDRLVVYRKNSITDLVVSGVDTAPFLPQLRANGIGCAFPWTLASAGQFHIFVGNDFNVYRWDGAKLDPIGTPIHSYVRQLIDVDKDLKSSQDWKNLPFATMFMGFKEYHLVIPQKNGTVVVLVYDYLRESWTRDVIVGLTALFEWQQKLSPNSSRVYDAAAYPDIFPTLVAAKRKQFFIIDERIVGDYIQPESVGGMEMFFDSPDMYYSKEGITNGTLERIVIAQEHPRFLKEPKYLVEVSTDRGKTFPTSVPIIPDYAHQGFEFADFNVTSNVRRYRFRYPIASTAARPSWRGYTDLFIPSGEFFPSEAGIDALVGIWNQSHWDLCLWG